MKRRADWRYILGVALVAATAAIILFMLSRLSRPGREELYLGDTPDASYGWSYELLVEGQTQAYEPVYADGDYTPTIPMEAQAVRISRTMTEEIPIAELEWHSYLDGVEVFLDGELLHTDFHNSPERGEDGFLKLTDEDWERLHRAQGTVWQRTRISLPADYLGKRLSVVTYFPEDWGVPAPEYPYLGNDDSYVASFVVFSVKHDFVMTVCALLALLVALMFLLDISNDGADGGTALLCLYFLLLFLDQATASYAGYYSGIMEQSDISLLSELYVAPLYLYLALRLKKRWKIPLCCAVGVWALYEGVRWYLQFRQGLIAVAGRVGPWTLAVFLAVAVAFCVDGASRVRQTREGRRWLAIYGCTFVVITLGYLLNKFRVWGSARDYLVSGIWTALRLGSFEPLTSLITDIVSILSLIVVVTEFGCRTLRTRQEMSVLQERSRQTMEGYGRLLAAESATNALHHELRHHMTALSGILKSGDLERAVRYTDAVAGDLDRLPAGRYSQNLLVDVISGSYLDPARAQGIRVEPQLNVPPELNIADEDLSVFLSNLLQNAVEACERMDPDSERWIRVEMRLRGKFLFIHCVNSAVDAPGEREQRPRHGYGLAAMRRIAEKHNSALAIERTPGTFSVMSDLCLNRR